MAHHSEEEIRQQVAYVCSLCCLILENKFSYTILHTKYEYCLLYANDGPTFSIIYMTSTLILFARMNDFYANSTPTQKCVTANDVVHKNKSTFSP
jgi:hypothetical protein